jgi:hypothetical protein
MRGSPAAIKDEKSFGEKFEKHFFSTRIIHKETEQFLTHRIDMTILVLFISRRYTFVKYSSKSFYKQRLKTGKALKGIQGNLSNLFEEFS